MHRNTATPRYMCKLCLKTTPHNFIAAQLINTTPQIALTITSHYIITLYLATTTYYNTTYQRLNDSARQHNFCNLVTLVYSSEYLHSLAHVIHPFLVVVKHKRLAAERAVRPFPRRTYSLLCFSACQVHTVIGSDPCVCSQSHTWKPIRQKKHVHM